MDSRVALVGKNGTGKSTLLKLMCDDLQVNIDMYLFCCQKKIILFILILFFQIDLFIAFGWYCFKTCSFEIWKISSSKIWIFECFLLYIHIFFFFKKKINILFFDFLAFGWNFTNGKISVGVCANSVCWSSYGYVMMMMTINYDYCSIYLLLIYFYCTWQRWMRGAASWVGTVSRARTKCCRWVTCRTASAVVSCSCWCVLNRPTCCCWYVERHCCHVLSINVCCSRCCVCCCCCCRMNRPII